MAGGGEYHLKFTSTHDNNFMYVKVSGGVPYCDTALGMGYGQIGDGRVQVGFVSTNH